MDQTSIIYHVHPEEECWKSDEEKKENCKKAETNPETEFLLEIVVTLFVISLPFIILGNIIFDILKGIGWISCLIAIILTGIAIFLQNWLF